MSKKLCFLNNEDGKSPIDINSILHLRIVVSDANDDQKQIVVTLTSLKNDNQDKSCIIEKGEHPFIKHRSIIDFKRTKIMSSMEILIGIQKGYFLRRDDISDELLKKIQIALKKSKRINNEIRALFDYL